LTRKITYIISDIDKALGFEWAAEYINKEKFVLSFILLNPGPSYLHRFLQERGFEVHTIICRSKKDWPGAIIKTQRLLRNIRPHAVHCHLLQANIVGLLAARLAGVRKRIYTRHHSSLHHVYFPKGIWLDKFANRMATHIVAISGIVKKILVEWEKVPEKKLRLIPHGFLLDEFKNVSRERIDAFCERHHISGTGPVVGVISRFTEWKGIQYIIPAFKGILEQYPKAVLLLLNAKGDYEAEIKKMLEEIPAERYRIIAFEKDIASAYGAMDVFVHVPVDEHSEAFGQIYVEALVAGVPSVFTRSGIANEPYFSEELAVMVPYKNSEKIKEGILSILNNKEPGRERILAGKKMAERFSLEPFIQNLENLYSE
jgi:glycosyltransferase involved in cell wall biosynthesis